MSTGKNKSKQERASVKSAKPVAVANDRKGFTFNISEEFVEVYKLGHDIMTDTEKSRHDKKQIKNINELQSKMDTLYHSIINAKDAKLDNIITLAASYLHLSYKYLSENDEEIILAESNLTKCIELLKGKELNQKCIVTAMDVYNCLGAVHDERDNKELSFAAYNESFQLYLTYTKEKEMYPTPCYIESYFRDTYFNPKDTLDENKDKNILDEKSILNMKSLLNWYANSGANTMVDPTHVDKIIMCQHKILKRKLNNLSLISNFLIWATVAGSLCKYFIEHRRFTEARDHLAVASFILKKYDNTLKKKDASHSHKMHENYQLKLATIARHWAKYGIQLLHLSQEKIVYDTEDKCCAVCNLNSSLVKPEEKSNKLLIFPNMRKDLEEFTATITDTYVSNYTDANIIFETVIKILNDAKSYYTLEKSMIMHGLIILDISQIHKYFAFYVSRDNKLILYEQRITPLLTILETKIHKNDFCTWKIFFESIIAINDLLDVICEDYREQYNQLKESATEPVKKVSAEIYKILKTCLKIFIKSKCSFT